MEVSSSEEEIAKSLKYNKATSGSGAIYTLDGKIINEYNLINNKKSDDYIFLISDTKTEVNIIHNWNNIGRTKIEIVATFKEPIYFTGGGANSNGGD